MNGMITIGISDLNVTKSPGILVTYALGSCVGICLYDKSKSIAGLAHIMLPSSLESTSAGENPRRYADTGIAELIRKMDALCGRSRYIAKIAGGAQMFAANSSVFNIGERNVQSVKRVLASCGIPIIAEQTGENFGRTVFFDAATGIMQIKSATRGVVNL